MSNALDPAWFYSSRAQVAGAIVGLIGALLGSRLVEHLQRMRVGATLPVWPLSTTSAVPMANEISSGSLLIIEKPA